MKEKYRCWQCNLLPIKLKSGILSAIWCLQLRLQNCEWLPPIERPFWRASLKVLTWTSPHFWSSELMRFCKDDKWFIQVNLSEGKYTCSQCSFLWTNWSLAHYQPRLQLRFQTGTGHRLLREAFYECSLSQKLPPEHTTRLVFSSTDPVPYTHAWGVITPWAMLIFPTYLVICAWCNELGRYASVFCGICRSFLSIRWDCR